jgi:hypothetical protein
MEQRSLFGEIALRLSAHPENTATEALRYTLSEHVEAWSAVRRFLASSGVELPESLAFSTQQVADDESTPDLVGTDSDGAGVFVLEAKFWAGLTPNQPGSYLRNLPSAKPGVVLVVAPTRRLETLWPKLVRATEAAGFDVSELSDPSTGLRCAAVTPDHFLAMCSWRALLGQLTREGQVESDARLLNDVDQLSGLCERMDSEAFLPLRPEDLSSATGSRIQQLADLVDSVVAELVADHEADTKNLTTGGRQSAYGRYFYLGSTACFLALWPALWAKYGDLPFWLTVTDKDWKDRPHVSKALREGLAGSTHLVVDAWGRPAVSIDLPTGVERQEVVYAVIDQVKSIVSLCVPHTGLTQQPEEQFP